MNFSFIKLLVLISFFFAKTEAKGIGAEGMQQCQGPDKIRSDHKECRQGMWLGSWLGSGCNAWHAAYEVQTSA